MGKLSRLEVLNFGFELFSINRPALHWIALIIAVENGQL